MPTTPRKARILLRDGKAKVARRTPFTIQLNYATGETVQEIILGVDAGWGSGYPTSLISWRREFESHSRIQVKFPVSSAG